MKLQVLRGAPADWVLEIADRSGGPSMGWMSTDALTARIWAGAEGPTLATPTASWADAYAGRVAVSVDAELTAGLVPSAYQLLVEAEHSGRKVPIALATVEVLDGPVDPAEGEDPAEPPRVYCSLRDMLLQVPWIGQFQDLGIDQAGFLGQRAAAREWMDSLIVENYRGGGYSSRFPGVPTFGGPAPAVLVDPWLVEQIEAGRVLLTTPRGRQLVRACASWACGEVLLCQQDPAHRQLGARIRQSAKAAASRLAVELDTNDDGKPEMAILLGSARIWRG